MTDLPERTGCVVVGGGPGGMFLAVLLARQGVDVTLLEMHHDFDREFRGDTIHPSTLELLDDLGLAEAVHAEPHAKLRAAALSTPDATYRVAPFDRLPSRYHYILLLPQKRLLEILADYGRRFPSFHLVLGAQANGLVREGGEVRGVTCQYEGRERTIRAVLTVGADGRFSKMRKLAGLEPVRTAPPMDVLWMHLPRREGDPQDLSFRIANGRMCVIFERPGGWQLGFVIPKGGYQQLRAAGIEALRHEIATVVPWLADRVGHLDSWSQASLLSVESSRLRKWYVPGLLLIGDAAHVMSPVGGVGINYAVQDAVAAANRLAEPIRSGRVLPSHLAAVQRRREWAVRLIQFIQGFLQRRVVAQALDKGRPFRPPLLMRVLTALPILRDIPGRILALGFGRERPRPVGHR
jgi:2-polyprenyl-6-methoxyphenol hydroxylase-like FAD-dependent oxidoreductase